MKRRFDGRGKDLDEIEAAICVDELLAALELKISCYWDAQSQKKA